jgi:hypothetical protein
MALRCLKLLNCPSFQSEFLPPHVPVQDNRTLAAVIERAKVFPARGGDGSDSGDSASQYDADSVRDWVEETASCGPKDVVSVCTLTDTWSKCSWSTILGHGTGDSGREGPRYELTHWHYHVKAAESLWAEEERGSDEWLAVYAEIDKFLDNTGVLQVWQKKVLRFRMLDEFDLPIHIASQYGILHTYDGTLAAAAVSTWRMKTVIPRCILHVSMPAAMWPLNSWLSTAQTSIYEPGKAAETERRPSGIWSREGVQRRW